MGPGEGVHFCPPASRTGARLNQVDRRAGCITLLGVYEALCAHARRPRLKQDCEQAGPGPERDASDQI